MYDGTTKHILYTHGVKGLIGNNGTTGNVGLSEDQLKKKIEKIYGFR